MHHVVIIVISVSVAMLTLCYSIVSRATLLLLYHASMLTLHSSFMSHALWLPQSVILRSLECFKFHHVLEVNRTHSNIAFFLRCVLLGIVCIPPTLDMMARNMLIYPS